MSSPARVLYVDDDDQMADLVSVRLGRFDDLSVTSATSAEAGIDHLEAEDFECVVCDYDLPEEDGLAFLGRVRERHPDLPFVLFTGKGSEDIASEAISAGVTDYVQKGGSADTFQVLANRVENAVQQYRTERALRESERRYRTLVERSHDGIFIYEGDRFVFANDRWCELTGYDEERLYEIDAFSVVHPDDRERLRRYARRRARGDDAPSSYETRIVTADGETRHLSYSVQRLDRDGGTAALVSAHDVTHRKEREAALERYETIVQAAGDPVYTLNEDGVLTFANERLVEITGYREDELLGEHVSIVMDEDDIEVGSELIGELLRSDEQQRGTFEMDIVTADGDRIPCENHLALLPFEDGEFSGTTGVLRDITERQEREQELERQNERLAEFARVVSHDLRNPLNVASLSLEIAREDPEPVHFDRAESAIGRMDELLENLLHIAKGDQTEVETEPVRLAAVVDTAWETTETGEAVLRVGDDLGTVDCDGSQTRQLFENLFRNAVEHAGPDVTVRVGALRDEDASPNGFFVEDDGPGLDDGDEELFSMGYSSETGGTGFGLAIVQDVARAHGWQVRTAPSDLGGARFEVTDVEVTAGSDGTTGSDGTAGSGGMGGSDGDAGSAASRREGSDVVPEDAVNGGTR